MKTTTERARRKAIFSYFCVVVVVVVVLLLIIVLLVVLHNINYLLHIDRRKSNLVVEAKTYRTQNVTTLRILDEAVSRFQANRTILRSLDKNEILTKLHIALEAATAPAI
jgi:type IV secretory pathway component VirB8